MPSFIDANNLQPFISKDLRGVLNLVEYISLEGAIVEGYKAEIVPMLCDVYLKARKAETLLKSQKHLSVLGSIKSKIKLLYY